MVYALFVIGFVLLIKGGDLLVEGGVGIARKFGLSHLVIGMTVIAFGTSAPEFAVNILASLDGKSSVALGNILGSNIANILLILGVTAIIYPMTVQRGTIYREIPFSMLAALVLALLVNDRFLDGLPTSHLSRIDGLILLCFFSIFLYYIFSVSGKSKGDKDADKGVSEAEIEEYKDLPTWRAVIYVIVGIAGLALGGDWIVNGAVEIARSAGMSERVIGLTIVAIGTSLPELVTSAVAATKKNSDIAIGNVVGSNIFNIFWVLGASATVHAMPIEAGVTLDIALILLSSALLMGFLMISKTHSIQKSHGVAFLLLYIVYIGRLLVA